MAEARHMNWALVRNSYTRKNENNQTTLPFIKLTFLDLKFFIINFWEYHESKLSSKTFSRLFKLQGFNTNILRLLLVKRNFGKQRFFYQCAKEQNFLDASFKEINSLLLLNGAVKAVYFRYLELLIFNFNLSDILTFLTCSFYQLNFCS